MLYDAVIFDLDGTLTDSARGILACAAYALEKMERRVPDDSTMRRFIGPPLADSFMRWCGMDESDAALATGYYRERYIPVGWRENAVFPGIRALLRGLKARGVYLAVATGKPEHTSRDILAYYGLLQYFDAVAGPGPEDLHADKGDLIRRVLPKGKKAVMIGDTAGDIKGAKDAGIDSVAVLFGYDEKARVVKANPTYTVSSAEELQTLLLGQTCPDKGIFLSVEGMDGCGKTTQLATIKQVLIDLGFSVRLTREPGGCPVSESIREILLAKEENGLTAVAEALLFAASRAQHVHDVILPSVRAGQAVVSDRFVDSSVAYQGGGRELGTDQVRQINRPAVENCMPGLTIYLKIDHKTAIERRKRSSVPDRIEQQDDAFFTRVENAYNELIERDKERFLLIDGTRSKEAVANEIIDRLPPALLQRGLL